MPKLPSLERLKKVVQLLSPDDRKLLFSFISDLPDSGISTGRIDPPEPLLSPQDKITVQENATSDEPLVLATETYTAVFLRGRAVFQVFFYPEGFRHSRLEGHSWRNAPPSEDIKEQIRSVIKLHGAREPSEDEIVAAGREAAAQIFDAETVRLINEFSARMPHMVWLLYHAGMKIVEIGYRNDLASKTAQPKKPLREIVKELEPYWKYIKQHLNLGPGGRQNIKHRWSVRDHACLAVHYDRLKPIWRGAKKTAKQALAAKEAIRRKNWKDQVTAAYKDEALPDDLVAQLAPNVDSQPADLALIHAARLCLPVTYSTKVLKQKLRKFNPVPRTSPKAAKNKGTS
jgi:hypothetical protein